MNKALALAFVILLIFVGVASYLVYVNLQADQHAAGSVVETPAPVAAASSPPAFAETLPPATPTPALWSSPTPTAAGNEAPATQTPSRPTLTPTPTLTVIGAGLGQVPSPAATLTATVTPTASDVAITATPTPAAPPSGSATPAGAFTFHLDGNVRHDLQAACTAQYLRGMVRDEQGNPLEGVRIKAYDQWGNSAFATSKSGPDIGKWDIVIGYTPNIWYVVVVDSHGNPISPVATILHHQPGDFKDACTHVADWRRAW